MHFVGFHPAYKYTDVGRTDLATLENARVIAQQKGMSYVYLGNTYEANLNDTNCSKCGATLVERYGLQANIVNLDDHSNCTECNQPSPIQFPLLASQQQESTQSENVDLKHKFEIQWNEECQSAHVLQSVGTGFKDTLRIRSLGTNRVMDKSLANGLDRFIISRQSIDEMGVIVSWDSSAQYENIALLDRAHFPTSPEEQPISLAAL